MYWARYPETVQRTVATRIVAKRNTNLENLRSIGRPIYRNKEERRKVPRDDKTNWFRNGGHTAAIMVATTPGYIMAKGIRELLKENQRTIGTSTKEVERPGSTIHMGLAPNNPFLRINCHRTDCPYQVSGDKCGENSLSLEPAISSRNSKKMT